MTTKRIGLIIIAILVVIIFGEKIFLTKEPSTNNNTSNCSISLEQSSTKNFKKLTLVSSTTKRYLPNSQVSISTDYTKEDKIFDKWTGDVENVKDIFDYETTVKISTNDIILVATYKAKAPEITTTHLPEATVGQPYSFQLQADYGELPLSWRDGEYINKIDVWGYNEFEQCDVPPGLSNIVDIAAGGYNVLALTTNNTIVTWGRPTPGDESITNQTIDIMQMDGGCVFNVILKGDGTLQAWGTQGNGRCDVPADKDIKQISVGVSFGLGLRENGTVLAWGFNGMNQCSVPKDLRDVIQVAAGGFHSLALKADGTVIAWGMNNRGQCNVPPNLKDIIQISAGDYHSIALKSDGTVVGWGSNSSGEATSPESADNLILIDAGASHNLGLKKDGTVVAWGSNKYGECNIPPNLKNVYRIVAQGRKSITLSTTEKATMLRLPRGLKLTNSGLIYGIPIAVTTQEVLFTLKDKYCQKDNTNLTLKVGNKTQYSLKIINGEGSGNYRQGQLLKINAFPAPQGYKFINWHGDIQNLEDVNNPSTTLKMAGKDIEITSVYKKTK